MPESGEESVIRAAGAVVWRSGHDGIQIALVHRPRYDDWSYPKGKCRGGEHVLATAVREVSEETGLQVILGRPLLPSVYRVAGGIKRVSYWAAYAAKSHGAWSPRFVPNEEIDQVVWLPAGAAAERLSYEGDVALLDELTSAPVLTTPFILLRHAAAGERVAGAAAGAADLARPLDPAGAADAKLLAALLACYGRCRVISSPAERCVATVRPYAAAVGVAVEIEPAFTVPPPDGVSDGLAEAAGTAGRQELLARAADKAASLAASGLPTVICAHRENLPALIGAASGALGGTSPQGQPLGKGAFIVLQSADGGLVSAERHAVTG